VRGVLPLWDLFFAAGFHLNVLAVAALMMQRRDELMAAKQCVSLCVCSFRLLLLRAADILHCSCMLCGLCLSLSYRDSVLRRPLDVVRELPAFDAARTVRDVRRMLRTLPQPLHARLVAHMTAAPK
jgi:hypothetical protein